MAAEWIPRQKGLNRKQEVLDIARATGKDRRWVADVLMEFWEWCDAELIEGHADNRKVSDLVELIQGTDEGFWIAVISAGWLRVTRKGLAIPNFERWLGRSAKRRLQDAERKRQSRGACPHPKRTSSGQTVLFCPVSSGGQETISDPGGGAGGGRTLSADFDAFWGAYPRKTAKEKAIAAWHKLAPPQELVERILKAVRIQASWEQWTKDNGEYIPHAATWLNGRRWEDEAPHAVRPAPKTTDEISDEARRQAEANRQATARRSTA
jgi:hypothetical protein